MRVLFFAGSARTESFNKKLAKAAYEVALDKNCDPTFLDLADFPLPLYDGDLEEKEGLPENAIALKKIFKEHDALYIASPEYNSSFSPLMKNTIDWVSRSHEDGETPLSAFINKTAVLTAASPGGFGGLRGLVPLRLLLSNIGVLVAPQQLFVPQAHKIFDDSGNLSDNSVREKLSGTLEALLAIKV